MDGCAQLSQSGIARSCTKLQLGLSTRVADFVRSNMTVYHQMQSVIALVFTLIIMFMASLLIQAKHIFGMLCLGFRCNPKCLPKKPAAALVPSSRDVLQKNPDQLRPEG